jgi:hypothetical protein
MSEGNITEGGLYVAEGTEDNQYAFAIGVTKVTVERILKLPEHRADALALYLFYAYKARWAHWPTTGTNEAWATNEYTAKGLGWGVTKVKAVKKVLLDLGLVTNVPVHGQRGRVTRWIIRVNFVFTTGVVLPLVVPAATIKELLPSKHKDKETLGRKAAEWDAQAAKIYGAYPLKAKRPRALAAIVKHLRAGVPYEHLLRKTEAFAMARAGNLDYCPHPATWFNGEGFNDDPATWRPSKPTTRAGAAASNLRLDGKTEAALQLMAADRYTKLDTLARNYGDNPPGAVGRQRQQLTAELAQIQAAIKEQKK